MRNALFILVAPGSFCLLRRLPVSLAASTKYCMLLLNMHKFPFCAPHSSASSLLLLLLLLLQFCIYIFCLFGRANIENVTEKNSKIITTIRWQFSLYLSPSLPRCQCWQHMRHGHGAEYVKVGLGYNCRSCEWHKGCRLSLWLTSDSIDPWLIDLWNGYRCCKSKLHFNWLFQHNPTLMNT